MLTENDRGSNFGANPYADYYPWCALKSMLMNFVTRINIMQLISSLLTAIPARLLAFLLAGCQSPDTVFQDNFLDIIAESGFSEMRFQSEGIPFFSAIRIQDEPSTLRIYIEGDGHTWITRHRASSNPTPITPLALELALMDSSSLSVAYLARPCQFAYQTNIEICQERLWTKDQYRKSTIQGINSAVTKLKTLSNAHQIELVGFSGGGTVALLVAAMRRDVMNIRTVAGNLNPDMFARLHRVNKLENSLNPTDYPSELQHTPQAHFIGNNDKVIPSLIAESYFSAFADNRCIQLVLVPRTKHLQGWQENWHKLLKHPLNCEQEPTD